MVPDTSLLNTQQYKVRIKRKVEQSRERSWTLPIHLGVVAIEKGAFGSPSTMVANFTYIYIYIYRERERGRQTDTQADGERETDKDRDTQTDG